MIRKKNRIILGCIAAVIVIAAAVFFSCFQITSVKVEGNKNYTEDEIRKMVLTGPLSGNSILVMMLNPDEKTKDADFIKKVWLERTNSHSIIIHVREKELVGYVRFLDGYLYFDREGIIQVSSLKAIEGIPHIEGLDLQTVALGEKLPDLTQRKLSMLLTVTKMLEKGEQTPDKLTIDESSRLFIYYGNVEVRMGTDENIDEKMSRMLGIIPKLEGMEGILHLENVSASANYITFEKKADEEPATEGLDGPDAEDHKDMDFPDDQEE